jgi:alkylated DNA repair dioxygenase AlkB
MRRTLFEPDAPAGFDYRPDFLEPAEERDLLEHMSSVSFANFEMHGTIARRRVAFFGERYDGVPAPPVPDFLTEWQRRVAEWVELPPSAFVMVLINEYGRGAPIGWHRDAPQYGIVVGLSLLSACRMRFRPYLRPDQRAAGPRRRSTHEIVLARRSAYLLSGAARDAYEHHVPAVADRRYSITFRSVRGAISRPPSR